MKKTTVLKRMIENNEFFVLPGGGCALHARIAEAVGFKVAYMSGMNACATVFGVPDAVCSHSRRWWKTPAAWRTP